ncbi:MAG: hypothetical protein MJZ73_06635 [Bacteroidaceae bacterium]|nr:hypothetical protein [Bacteroidaceae bacterium]
MSKLFFFIFLCILVFSCSIPDKEHMRKERMEKSLREYIIQKTDNKDSILSCGIHKMMFCYERGTDCKYGEGKAIILNTQKDTLTIYAWILMSEDCDSLLYISEDPHSSIVPFTSY